MAIAKQNLILLVAIIICLDHRIYSRSAVERECNQIGNILRNKGFSYPWWEQPVPPSTISGCPIRGKTTKCCPSSFDTSIHRKEIGTVFGQKWMGSKLTAAKEIFSERKKKFDMTFKKLMENAHTSFHAMFERTYGMLYVQHSEVFKAFFKTLEKYFDDGRDNLESKLNEFFVILTRKMFEVLNSQYDFTESYLSCAVIVINEKEGVDLHRQIVSSIRRSFVATRALSQALYEAERVISNMNRLPLNPGDCLIPVSQMITCPICAENRAYKPCLPFCTSVVSNCLSPTFLLVKPWNEFGRALEDLIDRLMGPYNVEAVVEPIHIKISEVIMNFQESGADLSQAVFSKCGKPTLKSRGFSKREAADVPRPKASRTRNNKKDDDQQSNKSLEKLLRDTKGRVRKSKDFWNILPRQVCNAIAKDFSSQMCWNGTAALKLDKDNTKGGRDVNNEEGLSVVTMTQPRGNPLPLVAEQILILQLIADKLKTAFNGGDIQWVQEIDSDDEFDGSGLSVGSGSGEIPTDLEDTDDDDPGGIIQKPQKPQPAIPDLNTVKKQTNRVSTGVDKSNHGIDKPSQSSPSTTLFNRPIHAHSDDDEDDEEGEGIEDGVSNLNIDSRQNRKRPISKGSSSNDFDLPPPLVPDINRAIPSIPIEIPTVPIPPTTTTLQTTTTVRTTTKKFPVTEKPGKTSPPQRPSHSVPAIPIIVKPDSPGAKTVAVVNVFTPVIMSMIQKLFNLN